MSYFLSTSLPFTSHELYVWAFCIGFNLAMIFVYILKSVETVFVSGLFDKGATSESTALTIGDLGLENKRLLKLLLRDNRSLRRVITLVKESGVPSDDTNNSNCDMKKRSITQNSLNFNTARFYIKEENVKRASSLRKGKIKWFLLPVFTAISIGLAIGLNYLIPILLNW